MPPSTPKAAGGFRPPSRLLRAALCCAALAAGSTALALPPAPPGASPPAMSNLDGWVTRLRGTTHTHRIQVTNTASEARPLCLTVWREPGISGNSDDVTVGTPVVSGSPCQTLAAGASGIFTLSYTMANGPLDGADVLVKVQARDQDVPSVNAETFFKVTVATDVSAPASGTLQPGQTYDRTFQLYNRNPWSSTLTYNVAAVAGPGITVVSAPAQVVAAPGQWTPVTVRFSVAAAPGAQSSTLRLDVHDAGHPPRQGSATMQVAFADAVRPTITVNQAPGVRTQPSLQLTIDSRDETEIDPSTVRIDLNGADVTHAFVTTFSPPGWAQSSTTVQLVPGANTVRVRVADRAGNQADTTLAYTYASAALDLSPHNGENVDVAQFGANLSYSTPSYVSMDVPRSLTLFYSSAQAAPRALVQVNVTDATPPQQYSILLRDAAGTPVALTGGGTESFFQGGTGGTTRLAAQLDAAGLPTGAYAYTVVVRRWNGGVPVSEDTATARVLVVNESASPFGAGWSLTGLQRIHVQGDGSLVVTGGDGTALHYRRPAGCAIPCTYTRPRGEWSELASSATGWVRTSRDGTRAVFTAAGLLDYVEDRFANRTSFAYTSGRLVSVTDPGGGVMQLGYTAGRLSTIRDAALRTLTVGTDAAGDLVSLSLPGHGAVLRPDYVGHRLQGWYDRLGNRWDVAYDHAGSLASTTAPSVTVGTQAVRPVTQSRSLAAAVLAPAGTGTTRATAAPAVGPAPRVSVTDARGYTGYATLDRFGAPVRLENALGQVTETQRDADGQVVRTALPSGHAVRYTREPGTPRVTSVVDETTGRTVHSTYTVFDQPLRTWGDTPETEYQYDAHGKLQRMRRLRADSTWATWQVHLGTDGRLASVTDPGGHATTYDYQDRPTNPWRNLTGVWGGPNGARTTSYVHDAAGRVVQATTPSDSTTPATRVDTEYDGLNRVTRTTDGAGKATTTTYQVSGGKETVQVTTPGPNTHTLVTNALGWLESQTDPRGLSTQYRHDREGNVVEVVNRRGQSVTLSYDELGRVLTRTEAATGAQTTWEYDNPAGRWVRVTNGESANRISLDAAGRPVEEQITLAGATYTLASVYGQRGMREELRMTAPWGADTIRYAYDRHGLLSQVTDLSGGVATIGRTADGQAEDIVVPGTRIAYGSTSHHVSSQVQFFNLNGAVHPDLGAGYTLDVRGRTGARWNDARTEATVYRYDPVGRLKEVWREQPGTPPAPCVDPEMGICAPTHTGGSYPSSQRTHLFTYDDAGNRTDGNAQIETGNRLVAVGLTTSLAYDADGNLVSRSGPGLTQTFTWNALGEMVSATTNGATTTYGYDGMGRRVRKTGPAGTLRYLHDGENLLAETDAAGNRVREYTFFPMVDRPLSMRQNGQTYYYLMEQPGHVTGLANGAGQAVNRYTYGPWGETTALEGGPFNPLRFGGREHDPETGLYYLRARYYDPSLGRFISEDPIGLAGGPNPYVYAGGDPVNHLDPSGLCTSVSVFQKMSREEQQEFLENGGENGGPGKVGCPGDGIVVLGKQRPGLSPRLINIITAAQYLPYPTVERIVSWERARDPFAVANARAASQNEMQIAYREYELCVTHEFAVQPPRSRASYEAAAVSALITAAESMIFRDRGDVRRAATRGAMDFGKSVFWMQVEDIWTPFSNCLHR